MPQSLSDAKTRNAKPKARPYKISDGEGLFLVVMPTGSKYWRLRYFFAGKEKVLALGVYPEVSLADARDKRAQARKVLAGGKDPAEVKKEVKRLAAIQTANSFEALAREWLNNREHEWAEHSVTRTLARLEQHVFPKLGPRPVAEITPLEVLDMLRTVEARGTLETAHRVKRVCGQVFMYGIATGRATRNPVSDLRGALKSPIAKHYSFLDAKELPDFLKRLEIYDGSILTMLALKLLLLTFVRTGELRAAKWDEIEWDKAEWRIPAVRMKMKQLHIVPLSTQAIATLRQVQKRTSSSEYLFPNQNNPAKCMSENTILFALYRMGYHKRATGHGFRSTASTILNEQGFRADVT